MSRVEVPIATKNPTNVREHWAVRAKRVKKQRQATRWALVAGLVSARVDPTTRTPIVVTLTRIGPRAMDDDGAVAAMKHVRDEIAAYFGVNDADPRIAWEYRQAKGKAAVVIEFEVKAREVAA